MVYGCLSLFTLNFLHFLDNQGHAGTEAFELLYGTGFHLEGLEVVLTGGLRGLPYGEGTLVLDVEDAEAEVLVEGRTEGGNLVADLHAMELVFADVERAPHVAHHGYGHDGGTGAYELADLGIDVGDFTFHLGGLNGLVHIGADFGHGTTGAVDLCLGGALSS